VLPKCKDKAKRNGLSFSSNKFIGKLLTIGEAVGAFSSISFSFALYAAGNTISRIFAKNKGI